MRNTSMRDSRAPLFREMMTMIGAILEMDLRGRITRAYIISNSDREEAIVIGTLARINRPGCWGWLSRLFKWVRR